MNRVVVTGVGLQTVLGGSPTELLAWQQGRELRDEGSWDDTLHRSARHDRRALRNHPDGTGHDRYTQLDSMSQLGWLAASRALVEGGLGDPEVSDAGVIVGTAMGCQWANLRYDQFSLDTGILRGASPGRFKDTLHNACAGWLAVLYGMHGPNMTLVNGPAAGSAALELGLRTIRLGRADSLLVGGVERLEAMHVAMAGPERVVGDGAAFLLLEDKATAEKRGANVLAEFLAVRSCPLGNELGTARKLLADFGVALGQETLLSCRGAEGLQRAARNEGAVQTQDGTRLPDLQAVWGVLAPAVNLHRASTGQTRIILVQDEDRTLRRSWLSLLQVSA